MFVESAAAVVEGCEAVVEVAGLFGSANKLEDGAGAVAVVGPLVAAVLGFSPARLELFSAGLPRLAKNPPVAAVVAGVAELVLAIEAPGLLKKPDLEVPAAIVVGVDEGCVVAVGVEDGKLNIGFEADEDEVPLPRALNKDGAVP